jgi:hypothetical protein
MIENYIVDTENSLFNDSIIDHEKFMINKEIYYIYNNKIDEPLHKFWFVLDLSKFLNGYYEYNILTFVINDKNNKIKKTIDYIQKLTETIKQKYISYLVANNINYDNIDIELPIKQYDNYPSIIKLYNKKKSIYNENNQKEEIVNLTSGKKYLLLFEINYFKIIKLEKNFIIKFFFNVLKIQTQKLFNVDDYSLEKKIITPPLPPPPPFINSINKNMIHYDLKNINDKIINDKTNDKIRIIISEEELLSKRNELKSVKHELIKIDKKSDENEIINNFTKDLILQKNLLKEVKKKKLKKTKKMKKSSIDLDIELEKELERELESKI